MKEIVYLDNAATTKLDSEALDAMYKHFLEEYANVSQPYSFSRSQKNALNQARKIIANCINADESEIYFTSGGSESDNWVIKCFGNSNKKKKLIVTTKIEHHAILNACKASGFETIYLDVDNNGLVDEKQLDDVLSQKCSCKTEVLVSIMMANNEIGTIEPIKKLAKIAHEHNCFFHTDAVQAVGHINVDVKDLNVDYLSASAHKFNGPKGIGFLYIKNDTPIRPLIDGGKQEQRRRAGTENVQAIIGMSIALQNNIFSLRTMQKKLFDMESLFIKELEKQKIDFIRNGAKEHLPGLVNISIKGANGEQIMHNLDLRGFIVSTGAACDSVETKISHVINVIKVDKKYAYGTIRVSFGRYNNLSDATKLSEVLSIILKKN